MRFRRKQRNDGAEVLLYSSAWGNSNSVFGNQFFEPETGDFSRRSAIKAEFEVTIVLVSNDAQNSYGSMDGHGAVSVLVVITYPTNKLATGLT